MKRPGISFTLWMLQASYGTMLMVAERNSCNGAQAFFRLDKSSVSQGSFRCILK